MAAASKVLSRSPLAPDDFPAIDPIAGARFATANSGIRYKERDDILLAAFDAGTTAAGVYTQSKTAAAPVLWCRKALSGGNGEAQGLLVNAGNANAFTGQAGIDSVNRTVEAVADCLGCRPSRVFVASTGVIGETLADEKIRDKLAAMRDALGTATFEQAARAIMTTDTFPKGAARQARIGERDVRIAGFAKGSGMIAPDMATMLAYVITDAAVGHEALQTILASIAERTFNSITVDSDTSTSDTLMVFATGAAGNELATDPRDPRLAAFCEALEAVCLDLAHQIVRDGEGASKFVSISVGGAENDTAARRIALAIANSPLVKTAIAGEDANWGRIVMAVGKAGEAADRDRLRIDIGGIPVADMGRAVEGYDETPVAQHMKGRDIEIAVDVGVGTGQATVWTCDLTHGYISINADYRS